MNKLWFRTKRYGWGWTPATWEGWTVTLFFVLMIVLGAWRLLPESRPNVGGFVLWAVICSALLMKICYTKGEKPRWRWGDDD